MNKKIEKIGTLFYKIQYFYDIDYTKKIKYIDNENNLIIEKNNLKSFLNNIDNNFLNKISFDNNFNIFSNGFQSWALSTEIPLNKKIIYSSLFKKLNPYIIRDKTLKIYLKNHIISHFFIYFKNKIFTNKKYNKINHSNKSKFNINNKIDNKFLNYIFMISKGNNLPPVTFYLNRKSLNFTIELFIDKKRFYTNELVSQIFIFFAKDYFDLKEKLLLIFNNNKNRSISALHSNNNFSNQNGLKKFLNIFKSKVWGWESWYYHYTKIDQDIILNNLELLYNLKKTYNKYKLNYLNIESFNNFFNLIEKKHLFLTKALIGQILSNNFIFQIDDGWEVNIGDWEINETRFSISMEELSKKIYEKGFIPGIWIAPFIVTRKSKIFKEKYKWILKDKNQKPVIAGFNPNWGGSFYCLDLSLNEVRNFIYKTFDKIINKWGFQFLKLDFLYAGLFSSNSLTGNKASYENYNKIMQTITSFKLNKNNKKIIFLGCGAPFELSYKYFDFMRIGADTKEIWEDYFTKFLNYSGRPSAYNNLKNTIELSFLNNTVFFNDPDVFFIRNKNIKLNFKKRKLIFFINFITSRLMMFSDDLFEKKSFSLKEIETILIDLYKFYKSINFDTEFGLLKASDNKYLIYNKAHKIVHKIFL